MIFPWYSQDIPIIIIIKDIQEIFRILWVQIRRKKPWGPGTPGALESPEIPGAHPECCALCTRRMLMRPDTPEIRSGGTKWLSQWPYDLLWFSMILYWKQPWWLGGSGMT